MLRARLVADASQFVTELNAATGVLGGPNGNGGLAGAATKSNAGMTVLRRGMVGLAMQATATSGPVGRITQGLLLMGGGSGVVLAVAAGIGAVALAFRQMTQDARDNIKAQDDLVKQLEKLGAHAQMTGAKVDISNLQSQIEDSSFLAILGRGLKGVFGASPAEQLEQLKRAIAEGKRLLAEAGKAYTHPFTQDLADAKESLKESGLGMENTGEAATRLAERVRILRLEYDKLTPAEAKYVAQVEREAAEMKVSADLMRQAQQGLSEAMIGMTGGPDVREARIAGFRALMQGASQEVADRVSQMTLETRKLLRQVADTDEMRQIGINAGKELVMGLAMGMESMQDFLKSVFNMLMDFTLGKIFGSIFGAIGGSLGLGANTGTQVTGSLGGNGISGSRVAPQQMSLSLSGMPAATNPLAAARDAMWQVFLRESIITAHSQGFRS